MNKTELQEILRKHSLWLNDEPGGERASLSGTILPGANLPGANLSWANLRGTDLRRASLCGTNLSCANLRGADLRGASLYGASLREANLYGANLSGADLSCANLYGAENIEKAIGLFFPLACPDTGAFIGWKKAKSGCNDCIVKLRICEDARRSSATGRKCRCDKADVLEVQDLEGTHLDGNAVSDRDSSFLYIPGETVSVPDFAKTAGKNARLASIFT